MSFESSVSTAPVESEKGRLFREKMLDTNLPQQKQAMEWLIANVGGQEEWLDSLNEPEQEEVKGIVDELIKQNGRPAMPELLARRRQITGRFRALVNAAVDRSLEEVA